MPPSLPACLMAIRKENAMTLFDWASLLVPFGCAIGAAWRVVANWREFDRWLVRTVELL